MLTSVGMRRGCGPRLCALPLSAAAVLLALAGTPAQAEQQFDNGFHFWFPFFDHRPQQQTPTAPAQQAEPRQQIDYSKAPPPKKSDTSPTTHVVVMGDAMADWLAYGLEDAFGDSPEIGVVRKHHTYSGLIHGDSKNAYDWPQAARDILASETADFVVMMIGLADRQAIREKPVRGNPTKPNTPANASRPQSGDSAATHDEEAQPAPEENAAAAAPEPTTRAGGTAVYEFHTEQWAEHYAKRIDEMIAVLKSKGVPVFWVGLPALRGSRSTADIAYLNNLYRSRAEKAGITFVDVWDGFVDENGNFTTHGPDFEGQIRRLRSADGVYFTKAGAQKLAHYAEREIQRAMLTHNNPLATPTSEEPAPQASEHQGTQPAARPAAGPVVPLTTVSGAQEELLGGGPAHTPAPDPNADKVLVKGEPPAGLAGRADDFAWPKPDPVPAPPRPGGASSQPAPAEEPTPSDSPTPKLAASPKPTPAAGKAPHSPKRAPHATAARAAPPRAKPPAPVANDWMSWMRPPAQIPAQQ
jgi:uncharacterized protein